MDNRLARIDAHGVHPVQKVDGQWRQAARLLSVVDFQLL